MIKPIKLSSAGTYNNHFIQPVLHSPVHHIQKTAENKKKRTFNDTLKPLPPSQSDAGHKIEKIMCNWIGVIQTKNEIRLNMKKEKYYSP